MKDFFRTIRENLKPGLLLGLLAAALLVVAAGDAFFALQQTGMLQTVYSPSPKGTTVSDSMLFVIL